MKTLPFANREDELERIENTLTRLKDEPTLLLRRPILEFYGVGGIGKSTLLLRTAQECLKRGIWYAFVDFEERANGDKRWSHAVLEISRQLGLSTPVWERAAAYARSSKEWDQRSHDEFVAAMVHLLRDKGQPAVLIFDTLDRADDQTLKWLEYSIRDLIDVGHLFIVLGSKTLVTFRDTREVTRKLAPYRLRPFSIEGTREQLEQLTQTRESDKAITDELLKEILDLTAGHPLGNKVVFDAILDEGLDPGQDTDRHRLVDLLFERVIERWILADIKPEEQQRYKAILVPLSVPRQFNLVMMQDLIRDFARQYVLPSSVAYMDLVNKIRTDTFLLEWDLEKHGYALDATMRRIFSLRLRLKKPERPEEPGAFEQISDTLANTYERWVEEVTGSDQTRYILERLYHMSHLPSQKTEVRETLIGYFDRLYANESFDRQVQLLEELRADRELKETVGESDFEDMVNYIEQRIRR